MADKVEKITVGKKLNAFLEKNKKALIVLLILCLVALVGFIVINFVMTNQKENNLAKLDQITYELTNDSATLEDAEIQTRINDALTKLEELRTSSGIVGSRANLLAADLLFRQGKFEDAIKAYEKAASLKNKSYIAPLSYYNIAVCYEELKDIANAEANYKKAVEYEDFLLLTHAKFSYGRILETQGKYKEAIEVYTELNDSTPEDTWAKMAKTRIIALQSEGKAE